MQRKKNQSCLEPLIDLFEPRTFLDGVRPNLPFLKRFSFTPAMGPFKDAEVKGEVVLHKSDVVIILEPYFQKLATL